MTDRWNTRQEDQAHSDSTIRAAEEAMFPEPVAVKHPRPSYKQWWNTAVDENMRLERTCADLTKAAQESSVARMQADAELRGTDKLLFYAVIVALAEAAWIIILLAR